MSAYRWRPLNEAPRVINVRHVVRYAALRRSTVTLCTASGWQCVPTGRYLDEALWEYRAEIELDRAVQVKIAEALGELIQAMKDGHWCSSANDRDFLQRRGLVKAAHILHTCMGGPIPDNPPNGVAFPFEA
jgi:hypothetical protein